jgi:rod shape-determining protein MreD
MRQAIHGGSAILAAFLAASLLRPLTAAVPAAVDIFTLAVLLFALVKGETAGAVLGAVSGLVVDGFSLGVFGVAGVSLTAAGFLTGYVSRKLNVQPWPRTLALFMAMASFQLALWIGLTTLIGGEGVPWNGGFIFLRPALTAALATAGHVLYSRLKARHER